MIKLLTYNMFEIRINFKLFKNNAILNLMSDPFFYFIYEDTALGPYIIF